LDIPNLNVQIGSLAGGGTSGGNVALGNSGGSTALTLGGDNTSTDYAGVISGINRIIKIGTGTQTFSGANTYTGSTTISAGTLQFTAALTLGGTATMQITGKTAGVYDVLYGNGSNTLTLGGTLALDNTGYTATYGDSIQIFQHWGSISGNFTSITGTGLNDGLNWNTANLGSTGFITVVPEPSTWALLAFSLTTVVVFRRRRRNS
jgi:autotransporter-associated beta strand protein